jgi:hypothetical protein
MPYICIGIGEGAPADAHRAVLEAYANAWNLPICTPSENPCSG